MVDPVGFLIVGGLLALFAFLFLRAWRIRRALPRWIAVVLTGLPTLLLALVLGLGAVGASKLSQRYDNPPPDLQVAGTAEQIARGQQLTRFCAECHTAPGQPRLSGSDLIAAFGMPPLGTLYAPNLTPAGNIQDWTDGEVIRAIREGIHKDGRSLLVMPANIYSRLSDEDVQAVVAYLRSMPAAGEPVPDAQFSLLGAVMLNLTDFRMARPPVGRVAMPPPGTPEYGKYMVDIVGCSECHGPQLQGKLPSNQPGPPPGPNLTAILPHWTEEQFMTFFNTGVRPSGIPVPMITLPSGQMPAMPWPMVRAMTTDDELRAMYAHLHSLPFVEGPVQ